MQMVVKPGILGIRIDYLPEAPSAAADIKDSFSGKIKKNKFFKGIDQLLNLSPL